MAPKRIIVFCDGTWCGRETGTTTNILALAQLVGTVRYSTVPGTEPTVVHPIEPRQKNIAAGYQEGVGLNKTFLEYLWDGVTASTIGQECISVYRFLVDNYSSEDDEIWLFGFSRGAYTVRSVAGMINNCGLLKKDQTPPVTDSELSVLCTEVYQTYRSPLPIDHPKSPRCRQLRDDSDHVWQNKRPVRLMVCIDTVGSMGIPRFNAGVGFDWPDFYDHYVSTVVKEMYHAPCLHDRFWIFQPCLAYNDPSTAEVKIHQTWFPGCHYDVGGQSFRFLRRNPVNTLERWLGVLPAALSKPVYPNQVISNLVRRWALTAIRDVEDADGRDLLLDRAIPNIERVIADLTRRIAMPKSQQPLGPTGSGDVYGEASIVGYAPGGLLLAPLVKMGDAVVGALNLVKPGLGGDVRDLVGVKSLLGFWGYTRDRRVPGRMGMVAVADVYPYKEEEVFAKGKDRVVFSVEKNARLDKERYPSRTEENWRVWRRVIGV
ncbi:uncharacterized protein EI97DRAFT_372266 [Westerdykella ornata]|uniref:T6SS Phospholipase effector Tle1-like catalytic domain-containing protein n=1 Tax=Westerdykella ornata TaxID=318751 RepID=A0A6A6JVR3_WESOR|nr:uncharacterized protein EI97DRAFT_372266 [Westerdykella ornata]KAF2279139.1 hypothetical protein EI97DRAFT_372266 [Westerdykella ornata]